MKKLLIVAALFATIPMYAIQTAECAGYQELATLYALRDFALRPHTSDYEVDRWIGERIEQLREPVSGGEYLWVRWVAPPKDAPMDKHVHKVTAVQGSGSDSFEASSTHPFEVKVVVPSKKSLFGKNAPVYVGELTISITSGNRTRVQKEAINAWMNPDTSRTFDLGGIADSALASADVSTARADAGESVVELHFVQARAEDDPANPAYDTIRQLDRIRRNTDAYTIDSAIASAQHTIFGGDESLPLLSILSDLRRADEMIHSKKADEQEKGEKLLRETMRRLR